MSKNIINFKILSPANRSRATNVISQLKDSALVSENTDACLDPCSEVNKNHCARPRLGRLDILPPTTSQATDCKINSKTSRIGTSLSTPAFIFYTQGANLIPHLTPDVAATLIDHSRQFLQAEGVDASDNIATPVLEQKKIRLESHEENTFQPKINITSIDHYINLPGYSNLSTSFADFNSSEDSFTIMDIHDPSLRYKNISDNIKPWKSGKEFATIATANGLHKLSPEVYSQALNRFKMDGAFALYDCMPNPLFRNHEEAPTADSFPNNKRVAKSIERTASWTETCINSSPTTNFVGSLLGGPYPELRARSALNNAALEDQLFGYLVANFYGKEDDKLKQLQLSLSSLYSANFKGSVSKPIFSWDFSTPREIFMAISNGVDIFDSTYPYLAAEYGHALTFEVEHESQLDPMPAMLDLNRPTSDTISPYQDDIAPISPRCRCYSCKNGFSRAYIVHLLNTHEMLAQILLMCHNLQLYLDFFHSIRSAISENTFDQFKDKFLLRYSDVDWYQFMDAKLTCAPNQRPLSPSRQLD